MRVDFSSWLTGILARSIRVALPPNIDPDEMVIDVNTKLNDVEHGKPDPFVSSCE